MAKRLQELALLNGTPRPQARLLIKDNPTGFLEDYSISVNDFKSDLIFSNEASTTPVIGQIPRLVNSEGVPALPAISARNLLHIEATLPTGTGSTQGLLRLSDATMSTSSVGGGLAVTPLALRNVNLAKPNISGASITGAWDFGANVTFNTFTATGKVTFNEVEINGNIVSPDSITIATGEGNIILAPSNSGATATTLATNGDIRVSKHVIADSAPTSTNHLTNKAYVDNFDTDLGNNLVHKSGNETITGLKTFTQPLTFSVDRVALEVKAVEEAESVIVDYGTNTEDYSVRQEVVLPQHADYGAIKYSYSSAVPQANREMYINGHKVFHQGNDGADSGLDADLLDGKQSGLYVQTNAVQTITAQKTFTAQTNFNSTVNFNTRQVNIIEDETGSIPRLVINGTPNANGHLGYIQFENRNGGEVGNELTTSARLLVSDNFDLNWNGNVVLTTANEGAGKGLDADTVDGLQASAFVNLTDAQNVNGNKTFGNKVTINNSTNLNKQFEITGLTPSINLSPSVNNNHHYRIQIGTGGNFNILRDNAGDNDFSTNVLDLNHTSRRLHAYGKLHINENDDANVFGDFTFRNDARININSTDHYLGTSGGTPILSSTGTINILANSNDTEASQPVLLRSGTDGLFCAITNSLFVVNSDVNTFMANFNYSGLNGGSVVRFTGNRVDGSSDNVSTIQSFNTANNVTYNLFFKANGRLEFSGTSFRCPIVDCDKVSLGNTNGTNIASTGNVGYVNNFRGSAANGDPAVLWGTDGGGLLIRGEDGLAGVIDSKNMVHIAPTFRGLNVNTGGFNVNSLANFNAGNTNYVNTRVVADAAVNVNNSDIVNVNGMHFTPYSVGLTFLRTGMPNIPTNYSSLKLGSSGIIYKPNVTESTEYNCAMLVGSNGISFPCLAWGDGTLGHIRTPNAGLLPFAPSGDARNTTSIGTASWRFRQAHIDTFHCYANLMLSNTNSAIITQQYTGTNEIFLQVRGRSSLSVGGLVNSVYNFQVDNSGSGIRLQASVTPTGAVGNDNMFSVKSQDGKPKLYVGSQRTGTQNANFYVGVSNNGSGGNRVIHEGDGGRLLTAEAII